VSLGGVFSKVYVMQVIKALIFYSNAEPAKISQMVEQEIGIGLVLINLYR